MSYCVSTAREANRIGTQFFYFSVAQRLGVPPHSMGQLAAAHWTRIRADLGSEGANGAREREKWKKGILAKTSYGLLMKNESVCWNGHVYRK